VRALSARSLKSLACAALDRAAWFPRNELGKRTDFLGLNAT